MRTLAYVAFLSLVLPATAAQRDQRAPGADEPVTIRGCLYRDAIEYVLRANGAQYQALDSRDWVDRGRRFALGGDGDILGELPSHERHEVEVTGHLSIPDPSSTAIIERPGGRGALPPGLPGDPFGRRGSGRSLSERGGPGPGDMTFLLVTAFEHVSLECRQ